MESSPAQNFGPSSKGVKPLFIAIIILAIFVAGSAAYLGFTGGLGDLFGIVRPKTTSNTAKQGVAPSSETEVVAFKLARQIVNDYSDSKLLVEASLRKNEIMLVFRGKVVSFEQDKNWLIERNGKSIRLNSSPNDPVNYVTSSNSTLIPANSSALNAGDEIVVVTFIDFKSGNLFVKKINLKT